MELALDLQSMLSKLYPLRPESEIHPHSAEERAQEFSAFDTGGPELEFLEVLHSLVLAFKPMRVLETGTGKGLSTIALAAALQRNGSGHLWTLENNTGAMQQAESSLQSLETDLSPYVSFVAADSLAYLEALQGGPFDFVFYDSLISLRHREFQLMLERSLLSAQALCVFHDTSRSRGSTMHDYSQETIDALDRAGHGRQWLECNLSRGLRMIKLG